MDFLEKHPWIVLILILLVLGTPLAYFFDGWEGIKIFWFVCGATIVITLIHNTIMDL